MKITPLEIRQKTFEKAFRGLDKDEVQAFLTTLSQEWEKVIQESKEFKIKLEASEREVQKLREVESSLFKTLKTAEDTGANLIDQATKTAELHMKETQMKAESLLNEARTKAKELMEKAEDHARKALEKMEDELKNLANNYRDLENQRENLIDELTRLTNESLEKLNRSRAKMKSFDVSGYLKKTKADNFRSPDKGEKTQAAMDSVPEEQNVPEQNPAGDEKPATQSSEGKTSKSQSFFDTI